MAEPESVIPYFEFTGSFSECKPLRKGHINDTYILTFIDGRDCYRRYILQRINNEVFKNPHAVMENLAAVTVHLRNKIIINGGNPRRETLKIIPAVGGDYLYKSREGHFWRAYDYIDSARSYSIAENPRHFYSAGEVIGRFHKMLADFPAHTLHETIPDFHNTPKRYEDFIAVAAADPLNRVKDVEEEIGLIRERENLKFLFIDLYHEGKIPLRVIHNDTKFNNILIDEESGEGLCLVDLDTVMPGLTLYDYGDAVRSGANAAGGEEGDVSKAAIDLNLFKEFSRGYLREAEGFLGTTEKKMLAAAPLLMTFECGMRFLEDYLKGDTYFKTSYDNQNLQRARMQLGLLQDMEKKFSLMKEIING